MPSPYRTVELSDPAYEHDGLRLLTFKSPALGRRGDVTLFVPPGADTLQNIPLAILLHGVYGSHWAWSLQGGAHHAARALMDAGQMRPMVLAMPSDGLWGDGSGYLPHGGVDYESWIVDDVAGCAAEVFLCLGAQSPLLLGGLSMGGYGALRLGAKYAARVAGISAHSAVTDARRLRSFVEEPPADYGLPTDETLAASFWLKQNRAILPPLRFDCGLDDGLLADNRQLHAELLAAGVPHEYQEFAGGHTWPYWQEHVADTLLFFEKALRPLPLAPVED